MISLKGIAGVIAAVTFITGFLFIDRGSISGNAIVASEPVISTVSIAGLALVFVSLVLAAYSIKR